MSRIDKLEKYKGLPIPYVVLRDKEGIPSFKINDTLLQNRCVDENLCTICGESLEDDMWFIGGPLSAFHPHGAYVDAPVHKECGVFALQNCPYMAYTKYKAKGVSEREMNKHDGYAFYNPTQSDARLPYFVFVKSRGYVVKNVRLSERFFKPIRPYVEVEYWKDGQQITEEDAELLQHEDL